MVVVAVATEVATEGVSEGVPTVMLHTVLGAGNLISLFHLVEDTNMPGFESFQGKRPWFLIGVQWTILDIALLCIKILFPL